MNPELYDDESGPPPSATEPDFRRERPRCCWDPSRKLIKSIRDYQKWSKSRSLLRVIFRRLAVLRHRFWSVVTGADLPLNTQVAGGLRMPHPNGVVVHPRAQIGPNCLLFQQVTIGAGGPIPGVPKLGGRVDVGAGAKVLGGVVIGDYARIGANAVVLCDVPEGATAVGIPARILPKKEAT